MMAFSWLGTVGEHVKGHRNGLETCLHVNVSLSMIVLNYINFINVAFYNLFISICMYVSM